MVCKCCNIVVVVVVVTIGFRDPAPDHTFQTCTVRSQTLEPFFISPERNTCHLWLHVLESVNGLWLCGGRAVQRGPNTHTHSLMSKFERPHRAPALSEHQHERHRYWSSQPRKQISMVKSRCLTEALHQRGEKRFENDMSSLASNGYENFDVKTSENSRTSLAVVLGDKFA